MDFSKFLFSSDKSNPRFRPLIKRVLYETERNQSLHRLYGSHNALWVTKLIIDSVHILTEKISVGRATPLRLPYRHWTEIVSGFGEPDGTPPLRIPRNTPGKKSTDFRNWGRLGGSPVKFNSKISLSLSLSLSLWL